MEAHNVELNEGCCKVKGVKFYLDETNKRVKIGSRKSVPVKDLEAIIKFASEHGAGKVLCNCLKDELGVFYDAGFILEGKIEGFFRGDSAYCMSCFICDQRKQNHNHEDENAIIGKCLAVKGTYEYNEKDFKYIIRDAGEQDINDIVALFSEVFSTYPTPVYDEEYIRDTMNGKILYKVAVCDGKIIGMASADLDCKNLNAEITDCATHPEFRGKGILSNIIYFLEQDLRRKGYITLYSLARAVNPGVNIALSKHDYKFKGRMVNNCNICGSFEDMNIWVKGLKTV